MKRLFLLLTLLLGCIGAALAQRNISGVVIDSKTGEKLPFVNVIYVDGGGTQTDFDGRFTLPFKAGRLRFRCSATKPKPFR